MNRDETQAPVAYYQGVLRSLFAGKKVIVVTSHPRRASRTVELLQASKAEPPLVLATEPGPAVPGTQQHTLSLGDNGADAVAHQFAWADATAARLREPDRQLSQLVDRYDPRREAWVYGLSECDDDVLLERRHYGWRRRQWQRYEDKTHIDACWDRWHIRHAASTVVPANSTAVATARSRLDSGDGVVLAGDASSGLHGGATAVRFAQTDSQLRDALSFLATFCQTVRVMGFHEGIPVSIHGIVAADGVAVFRPMELLVFRSPNGRFLFTGTSTAWQPPPRLQSDIREVARRAGMGLAADSGYRGPFAIDGIITDYGFVPTELNARLASGIGDGVPMPNLPLAMLSRIAQEETAVALRPPRLERLVTVAMAQCPAVECGIWFGANKTSVYPTVRATIADLALEFHDRYDLTIKTTQTSQGTVIRLALLAGRRAPDQPIAPRLAEALTWLDGHLAGSIGSITAARPVHADAGNTRSKGGAT